MRSANEVNYGGLSERIGNAAVESIFIMRLTQASKQVSLGEATETSLSSRLKKHDVWYPGHEIRMPATCSEARRYNIGLAQIGRMYDVH